MGGGESKEDKQREKQVEQEATIDQGFKEVDDALRQVQDQMDAGQANLLGLEDQMREFNKQREDERRELERQDKENREFREAEDQRRKEALEKKRKAEADANAQIQANITSLLASVSGATSTVAEVQLEADKLLPITEQIRELITGKREVVDQALVHMDSLVSDRQELQSLVGSILRQTVNIKQQNESSKNLVVQILGKDNEGGAIAWWELMTAIGWAEHSIESKYDSYLRLVQVINDLGPDKIAALVAQRDSSAKAMLKHTTSDTGIGANPVLLPELQFVQTQARSLIDAILDTNDGIYPALSAIHQIIMDETSVDPSRRSILLAWADRVVEQNSSLSSQERFDATLKYLHALQSMQLKGLVLYVSALRAIGEDSMAVGFAEKQNQRLLQQKEYLVRALVVATVASVQPEMSRTMAQPTKTARMSVAEARVLLGSNQNVRPTNMGRSFGGPSRAPSGSAPGTVPLDLLADRLVSVFA